ncbi:MAG: flagellin lysine-N-methylase [Clostridia bacterium]|nr:flagellin lysine-N-methylase [Clostridia bacterium]
MKNVYFNCYENFKCLAGNCPETCCSGWKIEIDSKTLKSYQTTNNEYCKTILKNTKNGKFFKNKKDGDCPFLNKEKLCEIIINLGENYLCEVCKNHPRFIFNLGTIKEINFSLSCEEAVNLLLNEKNLTLTEKQVDNEISPVLLDADRYLWLSFSRNTILEHVKSADLSMQELLSTIIEYGLILDKNETDLTNNPIQTKSNLKLTESEFIKILSVIKKLKIKNQELIYFLSFNENDLNFELSKNKNAYKNLISSLIFYHFYKGLDKYHVLTIIKYVVTEVLTIATINTNLQDLNKSIRLFTREIEHDDKNFNKLISKLNKINFYN